MKRFEKIMPIFHYGLIFFIIISLFSNKDNENIYSKFGFNDKYANTYISFNEILTDEEKNELIQKIYQLNNDYNLTFEIVNYDIKDDISKGINYYICADDAYIKQMLGQRIDLPKNFKDSNYIISTLKRTDNNYINISTFYSKAYYSIIPLKNINNNLSYFNFGFSVYNTSKFNDKDLEKILIDEFAAYNVNFDPMHGETYDLIRHGRENLIYISIVSLIFYLIYILDIISTNTKEIALLKLNGFKNRHIVREVFKDYLQINSICALFIPLLLTALIFRKLDSRISQFLLINIGINFGILVIFILSLALSSILIDKLRLSDLIKNRKIATKLTNISYLLLVATSLLVLPMINDPGKNIYSAKKDLVRLSIAYPKKANIYKLGILDYDNRNWEFDEIAYGLKDPNANNNRQVKLYKKLDDIGAIIHFRPRLINGNEDDLTNTNIKETMFLSFEINKKAYDKMTFIRNKKPIEITNANDLNIFIDQETYKTNSRSKDMFTFEDMPSKIYIFDKVKFTNLADEDYKKYKNSKAPIFIYTENETYFSKNLFDGGIFIDGDKKKEAANILKKNNYQDQIGIRPINEGYAKLFSSFVDGIKMEILEFLPGFLILTMLTMSFSKLYLLSQRRENIIKKSLGYSSLRLNENFIIELLLVLLVSLVFEKFVLKSMANYSLFLLLLIFLLAIVLVNHIVYKIKIKDIKEYIWF